MTADGANWGFAINASSDAPTIALPVDIPSGATVVIGIQNRTDETTTVSSVALAAGGTFVLGSGPTDHSNTTMRSWLYHMVNAPATSDAAGRTITVTFSGVISSQLVAGWCADDAGAQTFDAAATPGDHPTATDIHTGTVAAAGGGGIVGVVISSVNQPNSPAITADGANESVVEGADEGAGKRVYAFFEPYTESGTYGIETTMGASTNGTSHAAAFLTPAASGGSSRAAFRNTRRMMFGLG